MLAEFTSAAPCRSKANRPPSAAARAIAAAVLATHQNPDVVIDLAVYQEVVDAQGRDAR